jgi:excinuclease UvrABC nuclease subunit
VIVRVRSLPFQNYPARIFKAADIRREAPASSGVYGLSNAREWIYVGETDNIQVRLLEHLNGTDSLP